MTDSRRQRAVLLHLPTSPPIDIQFKDITYTVSLGMRKGTREILTGVSGLFKSGELTAIMGPSGAGKSSLLNILTGFQSAGMGGTISINTERADVLNSKEYQKESCYILQDDQLAPMFTVMESMTMAADLKLGTSISEKAKRMVIDDVLDTLGLSQCQNTRCERLSGGQKKRLSIALELVDNPPVMFLDEPTTGLDSSSSLQCIAMLKALARGGKTIICTIHQPSASIYEMFDQVYVLARGRKVYEGTSANTVPYLATLGFQCPPYHNPADYLLEVTNGDYGDYVDVLAQAANEKNWMHDEDVAANGVSGEIITKCNRYNSVALKTLEPQKAFILISPPSEWTKFVILTNRSLIQLNRDWTISHLKLLMHCLVGVILGLNFFESGSDGSKTISNVGYLLISAVYLCYTSMMPAVLKFPLELPVLKKERFNNWYNLRTYYIAFMVADIPMQMLFCTVYVGISYYMSNQPQDWTRFFMFLCICMLTALTAQSLGILLGTSVSPINGTFLGAISTAAMLVFAGFLVLFAHMNRFMYWISYLSYLKYALEGLVLSVYGYGREDLDCPDDAMYCHYRLPKVVLAELGMEVDRYWFNFGVLLLHLITLRIVGFITLRRRLSS